MSNHNQKIEQYIDDNFSDVFKRLMDKEKVVAYLNNKLDTFNPEEDESPVEQLFLDIVPVGGEMRDEIFTGKYIRTLNDFASEFTEVVVEGDKDKK